MSTTHHKRHSLQTTNNHQNVSTIFTTTTGKKLDKTEEYLLLGILASEGKNSASGKAALNVLILGNELLVKSAVKKAIRIYPDGRIFKEDMEQAGRMGLMRAIKKFDIARGKRLSASAEFWIRKYVLEEMAAQSSTVSLPDKFYTDRKLLKKAQHELSAINMFGKWIYDPIELANIAKMTTDKVESILNAPTIHELPMQTDEDDDTEGSIDLLADKRSSPAEAINSKMLCETIQRLLQELAPRDHEIIERYFGFNDFEGATHEEIARHFGVSAETVRVRLKVLMGSLSTLFLENGIALESLFLKKGNSCIN